MNGVFKAVERPVPVYVLQWTGQSIDEVREFCRDARYCSDSLRVPSFIPDREVVVRLGDFIVRVPDGTFHVYSQDVFSECYQKVEA